MVKRVNALWKMWAIIIVMFLPAVIFASPVPDDAQKAGIFEQASGIQAPFIENTGQIKSRDVSFYAKIFAGTIFVKKDGALTYCLRTKDKKGVFITEIFSENKAEITGLEPSPTRVNYFKGKEKRNWRTNIPSYMSIALGNIYKGIDLSLKAYGNNVEKLFTVLPGQSPEAMRIAIEGAKGLEVNEKGELVLKTGPGPVKFTKPRAFQEIGGKDKPVKVAYVVYKGNTYGFKVGNYDKRRPLIIDPLVASTFIGGSEGDYGYSVAIDGNGNVYVTGYTGSSDYPTTIGAYDESYDAGSDFDVFISKFDKDLSTLMASTFMGGADRDRGHSIAVDGSGNVYVTGETASADFPINLISTPYDKDHNDAYDVFVSKLDSDLSTLLASTFIGGNDYDHGHSIAIDGSGDVYVTGMTASSDYPTSTTLFAYDKSYNGGDYDVFVSKLNSGLSTLLASTFIGGASEDIGWSVALDGSGNVYAAGQTKASGFPTTPGAYDESFNSTYGDFDVFISKLDSDLSTLSASTFIGGWIEDQVNSIALDGSGNVYVTGETTSFDYPVTQCAYDETFNGYYDAFVSKLNGGLSELLASTFIGGGGHDHGNSIAVAPDGSGNVYITGKTNSSEYPITDSAHDESYNGNYDVFVSKLGSDLGSLLASTFIGGGGDDRGNSIAVSIDGNGDMNLYVTGETDSIDFPTTIKFPGAYDETYNGGEYDVFVTKLDRMWDVTVNVVPVAVAEAVSDQDEIKEGDKITLDGSGSSDCDGVDDIASYKWEQTSGPGVDLSDHTAVQTSFIAPEIDEDQGQETLSFLLTVTDKRGLTDTATVDITVMDDPFKGQEGPLLVGDEDGGRGCFISTAAADH